MTISVSMNMLTFTSGEETETDVDEADVQKDKLDFFLFYNLNVLLLVDQIVNVEVAQCF